MRDKSRLASRARVNGEGAFGASCHDSCAHRCRRYMTAKWKTDRSYFNAPGWTQGASAVPEPRTAIVIACGLLGLIFASRKRSAQR